MNYWFSISSQIARASWIRSFIIIFGKIFRWHIKYDIKFPSHVIHAIDTLYYHPFYLILKKQIIFLNAAFFFLLIRRKRPHKIRKKLFKTDWFRKCFIFTHTHYAFLSYSILHISLNVYIIIGYSIFSQGNKYIFIRGMLQKYANINIILFFFKNDFRI